MALLPIHSTLDCSRNYSNSLLIIGNVQFNWPKLFRALNIFLRNLYVKRHGVTASFHTNEPAGTRSRPGSNPTAENLASELWQFRLPLFRRRH